MPLVILNHTTQELVHFSSNISKTVSCMLRLCSSAVSSLASPLLVSCSVSSLDKTIPILQEHFKTKYLLTKNLFVASFKLQRPTNELIILSGLKAEASAISRCLREQITQQKICRSLEPRSFGSLIPISLMMPKNGPCTWSR